MYSGWSDGPLRPPGFPIRKSPDQCSVGNSPELIAATHVLRRLLAPRHPPHALSSLLTSISLTSRPSPHGGGIEHPELEIEIQTPALRSGLGERYVTLEIEIILFFVCTCQRTAGCLATVGRHCCGADRDRTDDPRLAKPVLSQLSYSPELQQQATLLQQSTVGLGGLEPPTLRLSGVRSNHLSYRPSRQVSGS